MFKNDMRDIELSDAARVGECSADGLSIDLFIKPHMLESQFLQLLVLLNAFEDLLEVNDVLEGDAMEAKSLQNLLVLHEFRKMEGGLS